MLKNVLEHEPVGVPEDTWELSMARQWVESRRREKEGAICPCCGLKNKVYKRSINSGHAAALIILNKHLEDTGKTWAHRLDIKDPIFHAVHHLAILKHWILIRENPAIRGSWTVTYRGQSFIEGDQEVPKIAYFFNAKLLGFSRTTINIHQALGNKFDYEELINGQIPAN